MLLASILCRDAAEFIGPHLISDGPKYNGNLVSWVNGSALTKTEFELSGPKTKGTIQTCDSCKSKHLSWYISTNSMGDL